MKTCMDCGKDLSFWQRMGSDRCAVCQGEVDRKQAEAERVAQQQAELALQARLMLRRKCPVCGSTRFRVGRLPDAYGSMLDGSNRARFRPEENLVNAYALEALACLDCGHVRLFLFDDDLAYLGREAASGG